MSTRVPADRELLGDISFLLIPANKDSISRMIAMLRSATIRRNEDENDLVLMVKVYSEMLAEYPEWAIEKAVTFWMRTYTLFPAVAELRQVCENHVAILKAIRSAFDRVPIQLERHKEHDPHEWKWLDKKYYTEAHWRDYIAHKEGILRLKAKGCFADCSEQELTGEIEKRRAEARAAGINL